MTTQNHVTIHHREGIPVTTTVEFNVHVHKEGAPDEWGAQCVNITTTDGKEPHIATFVHILTGKDWREQAARIRQAYRTAIFVA